MTNFNYALHVQAPIKRTFLRIAYISSAKNPDLPEGQAFCCGNLAYILGEYNFFFWKNIDDDHDLESVICY